MSHSKLAKIGAAFYYGSASFIVQIVNKTLFTGFHFPFPVMVALLQLTFMAPICYIISKPTLDLRIAKAVMPLAFVNVMNVISGLISTGGLSVPMFIALRRFTILITLLIESYFYRKKHGFVTKTTSFIMLSGAAMAAVGDLSFQVYGYLAIIVNDIFTSLYLVLVKNIKEIKDLSTVELIFYNSALSLPMLVVLFVGSGEVNRLDQFSDWDNIGFQVVLVATAVLGMTIHHSTFLCTRLNEPMMTMVTGQLKNMISTIVGAIAFNDFLFTWLNGIGISISMIGALWYAVHATLKQTQQKTELLPLKKEDDKEKNGKLKNYYTHVKSENGMKPVPVVPIVTVNTKAEH